MQGSGFSGKFEASSNMDRIRQHDAVRVCILQHTVVSGGQVTQTPKALTACGGLDSQPMAAVYWVHLFTWCAHALHLLPQDVQACCHAAVAKNGIFGNQR